MLRPVSINTRTQNAGISIVCGVKNRSEPLRYTIPTFLSQPIVRQVVLVDWDSDDPLIETLARLDIPGWPDPRVMIVRAENQPYWNLAKSINLGMKLVNQPVALKLDADILIIDEVVENLPQSGMNFVAGNWRVESGNQVHLSGTTLFGTQDFHRIGGYDERIDSYGWEDDDFYDRLSLSGLQRRNLGPATFFHLPHSDGKRMAHQKGGSADHRLSTKKNRLASKLRRSWGSESPSAQYKPLLIDKAKRLILVDPIENGT